LIGSDEEGSAKRFRPNPGVGGQAGPAPSAAAAGRPQLPDLPTNQQVPITLAD